MAWKQRLEIIREVATIVGLVAVPVLIAYQGGRIQSQIAEAGLKKEYVQIALGILSAPESKETNDDGPKLRKWAVDLLANYAPVPLPEDVDKTALFMTWQGRLRSDDLDVTYGYTSGTKFVWGSIDPLNSCAQVYAFTGDKEGFDRCVQVVREKQQEQERERQRKERKPSS